jgi:hypothetical protein
MAESSRVGYMFEQSAVDRERLRLASGLINQLTSEACVPLGFGRAHARSMWDAVN